eukprot:11226231-Lingulodinium_polyedra.AAC.1
MAGVARFTGASTGGHSGGQDARARFGRDRYPEAIAERVCIGSPAEELEFGGLGRGARGFARAG